MELESVVDLRLVSTFNVRQFHQVKQIRQGKSIVDLRLVSPFKVSKISPSS